MLNEEELRDAALLVFANKQDQVCRKGLERSTRLTHDSRMHKERGKSRKRSSWAN